MKKLIKGLSYAICILLLTCTFCLAQNTRKGQIVAYDGNNEQVYELKSVGIDTVIIKLMIEYETECANDSVIIGCTTKLVNDTLPDNLGGKTILWRQILVDVYVPKEPTFKDFVRWAAKKYGL